MMSRPVPHGPTTSGWISTSPVRRAGAVSRLVPAGGRRWHMTGAEALARRGISPEPVPVPSTRRFPDGARHRAGPAAPRPRGQARAAHRALAGAGRWRARRPDVRHLAAAPGPDPERARVLPAGHAGALVRGAGGHVGAVEFSRGCYGAFATPGTLTRFGPALRRPAGPIHW